MKTRILGLSCGICLLGFAAFAGTVSAETIVGGVIGADTTWMAGDSPYVVASDLMLANNATLTIEPGVEVRLAPSVLFKVTSAKLVARGTDVLPISFVRNVPSSPYEGIAFEDLCVDVSFDANGNYLDGSIMEHVVVDGASGPAIDIDSSCPFIVDSVIQHCADYGVSARLAHGLRLNGVEIRENQHGMYVTESDDVVLESVKIINNVNTGLRVDTYGALTISQGPNNPTWLVDNGSSNLWNCLSFNNDYSIDGLGNLDARHVWWGTMNPAEISAGIFDYMDNSSRGIVFYDPPAIPEPGSLSLLAFGAFGALALLRRKRIGAEK